MLATMRTLVAIAGILLMLGALVGGCATLFEAFAFFEPPHPDWGFPLSAPPEVRGQHEMSAGNHIVSIALPEGARCSLSVKRGDGSLVGRDEGNGCSVRGQATAGERWVFEATSTNPLGAMLSVSRDPDLMSPRQRNLFVAYLLLFPIGIFLRRKSKSMRASEAEPPPPQG